MLLVIAASCASGGSPQDGPVKTEQLNTWIERVHVESERARQSVSDSFERLNTLAAGQFNKEPAAVSYARFVQSIDSTEQQARRFREVVEPMLAAAQPVFEGREAELRTMSNDRMRQRGELRYAVDKERFDAISKNAVPARDQFDAYVKALRDHAAFLAHDLNASALDDIQDEVKAVARSARELDHMMETCQSAARAYIERASLPSVPAR